MTRKTQEEDAAELRQRAEQSLALQRPAAALGESELQRAVHDLRVHQIELQMQNEELRLSEARANDALQSLAALNDAMEEKILQRTEELAEALAAAQAASRAKGEFLSNISHELRTPMNGVIGMITLAMRRATDAQQIDWLGKAQASAEHLVAVVNDILDISSIEAGSLRVDRAEFRLGPVLELLKNLLSAEAARRGLDLQVEIDPALADRRLRGDKQRLGQVLLNLAGNGLKFTDRGGVRVRVSIDAATADELTVRFEVADTGIGIAAEDQPRLFHAFQQIDNSMTRNHGGTGLGLAISAGMVGLMGGQIGLQSGPGAGSSFWFTVPLPTVPTATPQQPPAQGGSAGAWLRAHCAGMRVLLAEDNFINQEVMRELLADTGILIDVASDGDTAVAMAEATPYALILMDVQLPGQSGIEATRAIRSTPARRHTPIIALTASVFEPERLSCFEAGMNDHIPKPVVPELLYRTLMKWLRPA
jgi:signal transduction histidine kinase